MLYALWLFAAGQQRQDGEDLDLGPSCEGENLDQEQREEDILVNVAGEKGNASC